VRMLTEDTMKRKNSTPATLSTLASHENVRDLPVSIADAPRVRRSKQMSRGDMERRVRAYIGASYT